MKFFFQNPFSIKKVLIFGGFGLCRFQHKVGMNSFPMRMNVISYGTNSFPWGMYSFRSKIPIVFGQKTVLETNESKNNVVEVLLIKIKVLIGIFGETEKMSGIL